MGAAGSDAAMRPRTWLLRPTAFEGPVAHQPFTAYASIILADIALSLSVKALFVVLTFAGHSSLWAAIAADLGASLLVIANGLRLLRE
jgi:Cd2+/Zn2+-exporting ATPase